jgi:hypothetical protein
MLAVRSASSIVGGPPGRYGVPAEPLTAAPPRIDVWSMVIDSGDYLLIWYTIFRTVSNWR